MLKTVGFPSTRTGDQTIVDGNLVIGTSGKGIDFSATSGTGTSELLDDYEEGNWTPTDASGAGLTFLSASGTYTKIGNQVFIRLDVDYPVTADASQIKIGNLPFAPNADCGASIGYNTYVPATPLYVQISNATNSIRLLNNNGAFINNVNMSASRIQISGVYLVN